MPISNMYSFQLYINAMFYKIAIQTYLLTNYPWPESTLHCRKPKFQFPGKMPIK